MDEKTLKELEAAHKKAMEGINAFNKSMNETVDAMYKYVGLERRKK